ncbi:hypothetical protein GCM10007391_21020 [Alteromonas halophila]|uniref:Glycosyl transferase family 1 domain-containing protein n=2 Tax=Alteromonas halophila TaxID=516698 RepID=A0A918JMZ7_9ALTE|nr:hypothetical protein GCM10007391_21020 [Alteromonas halophila]
MLNMGIEQKKVHTIYNGVDHDLFSQETRPPTDSPYVLFVGNLKHDKGVMELLRGFEQISALYPDLTLYYAGDGPMRASLESYCKNSTTLAANVTFLGQINHNALPAWMQHTRCLALPSYNEGVPNVVLEAMSCGQPILATKVGGIPEVVPDYCGVLIAPRSHEEVATGLRQVLDTSWNSEQIKRHASQYNWKRNREQLLQLLSL